MVIRIIQMPHIIGCYAFSCIPSGVVFVYIYSHQIWTPIIICSCVMLVILTCHVILQEQWRLFWGGRPTRQHHNVAFVIFEGNKFHRLYGDFTVNDIFIFESLFYQDTFHRKDTSELKNTITKIPTKFPSVKYMTL